MDVNIGRDTLLALAAVAWADGRLDPHEALGIRSAAEQLLNAEDMLAFEPALEQKVSLNEVETVRMNRLTRLFTYAVASWVAELDGSVVPEEQTALELLGDRLGLSVLARARAKTVAQETAQETAPAARYDLVKLRGKLALGLSNIGDE